MEITVQQHDGDTGLAEYLQAQQDGAWKTIATGKTLGRGKEISFAPVTARVFRLNILKADDLPTICEFELIEMK